MGAGADRRLEHGYERLDIGAARIDDDIGACEQAIESRWIVNLDKVGGRWLVDDFQPVS